ncbi:hypothetical protein GUITHDRAFT_162054 [Guillardia theta CCMP2712]|uniref:Uncharacterized protein n=1 Tax=Guillardia theta (strain CCMP2712) TaxID=905079 RepID=L1JM18_GUITC|nr:hypothetical protein GUITHDRAFT_162054 [Guillardia theta CCMP2712]EKX49626.1 hypothetical protein GUITHDRAFT_162054 [Guillardia theta CCMP2712]|eukprot:XP_005836606.1 hypothetical protein GUITHDRAFT_162054 [Guillardia theta CCMP2712]
MSNATGFQPIQQAASGFKSAEVDPFAMPKTPDGWGQADGNVTPGFGRDIASSPLIIPPDSQEGRTSSEWSTGGIIGHETYPSDGGILGTDLAGVLDEPEPFELCCITPTHSIFSEEKKTGKRKAPEAPVNHTINLLSSQNAKGLSANQENASAPVKAEMAAKTNAVALKPNTSKGVVGKKKNNVDPSFLPLLDCLTCLQTKIKSEEATRIEGPSALARPVVKFDANAANKPVAFAVPGLKNQQQMSWTAPQLPSNPSKVPPVLQQPVYQPPKGVPHPSLAPQPPAQYQQKTPTSQAGSTQWTARQQPLPSSQPAASSTKINLNNIKPPLTNLPGNLPHVPSWTPAAQPERESHGLTWTAAGSLEKREGGGNGPGPDRERRSARYKGVTWDRVKRMWRVKSDSVGPN